MTVLERAVVPIAQLKPAPYNPRRIDNAALAGLEKSVERFGVVQEVVVNRRTGHIVGGHQRIVALRNLGEKFVPIVYVDLDDVDEKALNIALNSQLLSGEFTDQLQALLTEIEASRADMFQDLRMNGLRAELVDGLLARGDPDDAPALPETPVTQLGDVWELGRHRLVCGDCTDPVTIAAVMRGDRAHQLLTDPPYGVDYLSNVFADDPRAGKKGIAGDARVEYRAWFANMLRGIPFQKYATIHVFMGTSQLHNMRLAFDDAGYTFSCYLVWVKNALVLGRSDYQPQHEWIAYGWPQRHRFFGPANRTTVLEFPKPRKSDLHPTMKPVAMLEQLIGDGAPDGAIVVDCFAGSGSTLIACETTGRKNRSVEIDPHYCDVIVERFRQFTGEDPVRIPAGGVAEAV